MSTARVNALMNQMTTAEKIGQLLQMTGDAFQSGESKITGPMQDKHLSTETVYAVGSVLGTSGAKQVKEIQKDYLAHNRLHIPLMFMADVIHGYQTIYPIPLGLGATFNPEMVRQTSEVAARISAAGGIQVTFAPMVDLVRDPRWGRVMESTGEDPYLNSVMTQASVEGFQGELPLDKEHIAACVKHFAAYGAPEAGREYNTVDLSEWRFREQYLPAYAAAIEAQAMLVMTSFNTLFGVPASANQHLMRDILRDELNFHGVLISDWNAVGELIRHGVAANSEAATALALKAGVDIDMMSFAYASYLKKAADLDDQTLALINEAAVRVLELKEKLGLFDDPFRGMDEEKELHDIHSDETMAVVQQAAEESLVLLKNDQQVLPLHHTQSIALIGPVIASNDLLGAWSWNGHRHETETLEHAFKADFNDVKVATGCDYRHADAAAEAEALAIAEQQDVIVAVLGLPSSESGEASSLANIKLPQAQLELLAKLAKLNKPIISVIITGRAMDLTRVNELSTAIVVAWFPGTKGAIAIKNVLDGTVSPNGKLPMTFPRSVGQVPIYYNQYRTGRPVPDPYVDSGNGYESKYMDCSTLPLYPFGFGLSYADITIEKVEVIHNVVTETQPLTVNVTIKNNSDFAAKNVLQGYTHQLIGETVRPMKELKYFAKITFPAHSEQTITVTIAKEQLSSVHTNLKRATDAGHYEVMIGFDSEKLIKCDFEVQ
ncbi:glycoside hydrolase family 3 N-terminal domain-containing protein [Lapidilactobacillus bayanensis]|uniref:glycoside hydrolase family 3 N-terminal domain-containing protein n=1 Tax=Lapidilactobacillus bayanensis TaxID=2485998 RepID=UPI000F79F8AD|nr:glycoside hydrolase family 3 N-terminal domain-containing protein [Lapidilactobacillus bayanensis]